MSAASALEQYMLELINAERRKAGAQPLAFNTHLNAAADGHSAWMIAADTFSHTGSGGSTPTQRMARAGFEFTGAWGSAENIAWASLRAPAGLQDEVQLLHANLMNSPGHRTNLLNDTYSQVGIGFATGQYQSWDSAFVTQNFAVTGTRSFLTGVAYRDRDGDRFYDPGEGLGGLAVSLVSGTGARYATKTSAAGGYDIALPAGTYTVTFSGGTYAATTRQVSIGGDNVKLDLVSSALAPTSSINVIKGTAGDDVLTGLGGSDSISGGAGADRLSGEGGSDILSGGTGGDRISGGAGSDRLSGGDGNDFLSGGSGNDRLSGGSGADRLSGGSGQDTLSGDAGKDVLTGGLEADVFRFRGEWGSDRITDFQAGIDRLDLRTTGLSLATLSILQRDMDRDGQADDVLVRANGQAITLLDMSVAALRASDFLF